MTDGNAGQTGRGRSVPSMQRQALREGGPEEPRLVSPPSFTQRRSYHQVRPAPRRVPKHRQAGSATASPGILTCRGIKGTWGGLVDAGEPLGPSLRNTGAPPWDHPQTRAIWGWCGPSCEHC